MSTAKFVIQQHTTPTGVHWDFMLEEEDRLLTWRINCPPEKIGRNTIEAVKIFDHSLRFLTYEGPVRQETGQVQIAEAGTYKRLEWTDDSLLITLCGRILNGRFRLQKQNEIWFLQQLSDV